MPNKSFYSTDRDAPVMSGSAGTLLDVLDACLVVGTPAQTVNSLTRSGTTATLQTATSHGYKVGQEITVTGATEPEWNGQFTVDTVVDADEITYILGSTPSGSSATGTIKIAGEKTQGTASSVTRSGSTVTVNLTSHGFVANNRVRIEGAVETDYNGVWVVASAAADSFTFDIGTATPSTPATGTILVRYGQAGAGWTKPFTGASKAAYKQGGGNGYYLRVNDANNGSTARAYVAGYTAMTDVDSGSNKFPSNTDSRVWCRSNDTTGTVRPWKILASDKLVHFLAQTGENPTNGTGYWHWGCFGDFKSFNTVATYDCVLSGRIYSDPSQTTIAANASVSYEYQNYLDQYGFTTRGSYPWDAAGTNAAFAATFLGKFSNPPMQVSSAISTYYAGSQSTSLAYPNVLGNSLVMFPMYLYQSSPQTQAMRGSIPGVWVPCHNNPANNGDTFSGSGALAGRSFIVLRMGNGTCCFELSDTWDD
jgi:hypothetical protein